MFSALLPAQQLTLLQVHETSDPAPGLELSLRLDPGAQATEALESGLVLGFLVQWELTDGRALVQTMTLRYSPLLRAYALTIGNAPAQTYTLRNAMFAAFEQARLRWEDSGTCSDRCAGRVRVTLDRARLPAPLRLPSLLQSDWALDTGWHEVQP